MADTIQFPPTDDGSHGDGVVQLLITGLRATGFHGVLEQERLEGQEFQADLLLTVAAPESDHLEKTVDYSSLALEVVSILRGDPVNLIETLAERIASHCLTRERVLAVTASVHKPHAPIAGIVFDDIVATVTRRRP